MHPDITEVLLSEEQIRQRVSELGAEISADYAGEDVVVVSVLRGAAIFGADLVRALDVPVEMDFIAASSYGDSHQSSGEIRITKDLSGSIEGKHVVIVEDILDTGLTLRYLEDELSARGPKSIAVAVFLRKEGAQKVDVNCKYVGFACPDGFIVGYGLDYAQRYRNLPYVGLLNPDVYQK